MKKPILSFTSHKARLPFIDDVFRSHLANAEACGMDMCFACQDDSLPCMTPYQRSLVDSGKVELLHVPKDHGSNTKWTLCRAAHPDATMIVVDDDRCYTADMFSELLRFHDEKPGAFACRALRKLVWRGGRLCRYHLARRLPDHAPLFTSLSVNVPTPVGPGRVVVEHWAGCLYPPGFGDPAFADEAREKAFHDDDVFTTVMLARAKVPVYLVPTGTKLYERDVQREVRQLAESALGRENRVVGWGRTDRTLKTFEKELAP